MEGLQPMFDTFLKDPSGYEYEVNQSSPETTPFIPLFKNTLKNFFGGLDIGLIIVCDLHWHISVRCIIMYTTNCKNYF